MAKDDDREVVNANNSTPEEQERERLRAEVEKRVEDCKLTDSRREGVHQHHQPGPCRSVLETGNVSNMRKAKNCA